MSLSSSKTGKSNDGRGATKNQHHVEKQTHKCVLQVEASAAKAKSGRMS